MTDAFWSAISNPSMIVGRDGAGTIWLLAGFGIVITAGFMAIAGRRMMVRSRVGAVLMGGLFLPVLLTGGAFVLSLGHPSGMDGGGILFFVSLVLSICALPVTMATSVLYVILRRRRLVD